MRHVNIQLSFSDTCLYTCGFRVIHVYIELDFERCVSINIWILSNTRQYKVGFWAIHVYKHVDPEWYMSSSSWILSERPNRSFCLGVRTDRCGSRHTAKANQVFLGGIGGLGGLDYGKSAKSIGFYSIWNCNPAFCCRVAKVTLTIICILQ